MEKIYKSEKAKKFKYDNLNKAYLTLTWPALFESWKEYSTFEGSLMIQIMDKLLLPDYTH